MPEAEEQASLLEPICTLVAAIQQIPRSAVNLDTPVEQPLILIKRLSTITGTPVTCGGGDPLTITDVRSAERMIHEVPSRDPKTA